MRLSLMRAMSAKSQLFKAAGGSGSHAHATAATTRLREEKVKARADMTVLNQAFTQGTRAENKQAAIAQARVHNSRKKLNRTGQEMYEIQPVLSAGDKFRQSRLGGEPIVEAASALPPPEATQGQGGSLFTLLGVLALGAVVAVTLTSSESLADADGDGEFPSFADILPAGWGPFRSSNAPAVSNTDTQVYASSAANSAVQMSLDPSIRQVLAIERAESQQQLESQAMQPLWLQRRR